MRLAQRYESIVDYFRQNAPEAASELNFRNPYELIVAVILSAQCTDKRVNLTTPELFKTYPSVEALAEADEDEVFEIIRSISYPRSKARHIIGSAKKIVSDFNSEVPSDIDALLTLPGVGRKTANVVASIVYNEPVIAVDTHVFRVARRIGLSRGSTPRAVELDLEKHIAEELRPIAHHWLILHGRYVCTAKKPQCEHCGIKNFCKSFKD